MYICTYVYLHIHIYIHTYIHTRDVATAPLGGGRAMTPLGTGAAGMAWVRRLQTQWSLWAIWAGAGVGRLPTVGPATWGGATVDCSLNGSRSPKKIYLYVCMLNVCYVYIYIHICIYIYIIYLHLHTYYILYILYVAGLWLGLWRGGWASCGEFTMWLQR